MTPEREDDAPRLVLVAQIADFAQPTLLAGLDELDESLRSLRQDQDFETRRNRALQIAGRARTEAAQLRSLVHFARGEGALPPPFSSFAPGEANSSSSRLAPHDLSAQDLSASDSSGVDLSAQDMEQDGVSAARTLHDMASCFTAITGWAEVVAEEARESADERNYAFSGIARALSYCRALALQLELLSACLEHSEITEALRWFEGNQALLVHLAASRSGRDDTLALTFHSKEDCPVPLHVFRRAVLAVTTAARDALARKARIFAQVRSETEGCVFALRFKGRSLSATTTRFMERLIGREIGQFTVQHEDDEYLLQLRFWVAVRKSSNYPPPARN